MNGLTDSRSIRGGSMFILEVFPDHKQSTTLLNRGTTCILTMNTQEKIHKKLTAAIGKDVYLERLYGFQYYARVLECNESRAVIQDHKRGQVQTIPLHQIVDVRRAGRLS